MDRDHFWRLIDELGPDHDVEAMISALVRRSGDEISGFWDHLVECAAVLKTDEFYDQGPVDVGDDPADRLPLGDDAFLEVRLAVVGHGKDTYDAVVADPTRFGAVWPFELGADLVEAVGAAFEQSTGDPWPALNPDIAGPLEYPRASRHAWLTILIFDGHAAGPRHLKVSPVYRSHLAYLAHLLNDEPRWWDWWDQARGEESYLIYEISPAAVAHRRSTLRQGRNELRYDQVVVAFRVPAGEYAQPPEAVTPALGWAMLARSHFDLLFAKITTTLGLEPLGLLSSDTAELERQRKRWENEKGRRENDEARAMEVWHRHRSSEHIWRGRAPDQAVDKLVAATRAGRRRVALPQMIAELRATHDIALAPDDAQRLAVAGYTSDEISVALAT